MGSGAVVVRLDPACEAPGLQDRGMALWLKLEDPKPQAQQPQRCRV